MFDDEDVFAGLSEGDREEGEQDNVEDGDSGGENGTGTVAGDGTSGGGSEAPESKRGRKEGTGKPNVDKVKKDKLQKDNEVRQRARHLPRHHGAPSITRQLLHRFQCDSSFARQRFVKWRDALFHRDVPG